MTGNYLLSVRLPLCATETSMFQRPEDLFCQTLRIPGTFAISSTLALRKPCKPPYISTTFADVLARRLQWFPGNGIFDLRPFLTVPANRVIV